MAGSLLAHAIDADMAGLDQRGGAGAGLHHPCMPQPFIETLALQPTPLLALILAIGGELFLERRPFGKRRIGGDRTLAFARAGAGGVLPVRRAPVRALIASAFVAAAQFA